MIAKLKVQQILIILLASGIVRGDINDELEKNFGNDVAVPGARYVDECKVGESFKDVII